MSVSPSTTRAACLVVIALAGVAVTWVISWSASRTPEISPGTTSGAMIEPKKASQPPEPPRVALENDQQVLNRATRDDLLAALRKRITNGASSDEIAAALAFLARTRPELALELTTLLARDSDEKYRWTTTVLGQWTQNDPAAAWTWTLQPAHRLDLSGDSSLPAVVLARVVATDPKLVVTLVEALLRDGEILKNSGFNAEEIANAGVQALMQGGHEGTALQTVERWLTGDAPLAIGNAAIEQVALHLAQYSPQNAADWLRKLPVSDDRNFALATLAADWSAKAPQAAMEWATKLDTNDGRSDAMQRSFNRWAEQDLVAAAQWLGENESHPTADRLIANLVADSRLSSTDPHLATQWAALIVDPALRTQSTEQALHNWADHDSAAAARYITENKNLSGEEKVRLLQSIRGRPTEPRG